MIVFNKKETNILRYKLRKYYPRMNEQSIEDCIQDAQLSLIKYNTKVPSDIIYPVVFYWGVVLRHAKQARRTFIKKKNLFIRYKTREVFIDSFCDQPTQYDILLKKEGYCILNKQLKQKIKGPKELSLINEVLKFGDVKEAATNLNINHRIAFQTLTNIAKKLDVVK